MTVKFLLQAEKATGRICNQGINLCGLNVAIYQLYQLYYITCF